MNLIQIKEYLLKVVVIAIILIPINTFGQQAWSQKKGESYLQLGSAYLTYSMLHVGNFEIIDLPRPVSELVIASYSEYGISDKLTGILNLPYHIVSVGELDTALTNLTFDKGCLSSLGNITTGLLYNFYKKNSSVISARLDMTWNTSKREFNTGLSTGNNSMGISPSIAYGIGKKNYFFSADFGANILFQNDYYSRINMNAQFGKRFLESKKMTFILGLGSSTAFKFAEQEAIKKSAKDYTGLYVEEQSYVALTLKLGYDFTPQWSIWTSMAGGEATNVGAGISSTLSIAYKFSKKK